MKRIKRFILSLLLTKQERVMIWNALWFSNHTYRRRGNVFGADAVQMVMNRTEGLIVPKGRKYSKKELVEIVEGVIKEAGKISEHVIRNIAHREFNKGYQKGKSERTIEDIAEQLRLLFPNHVDGEITEGMEFDRENCIVFALVFGQDKNEDAEDNDSKPTEGEDTEKEENNEEQAPEGTDGHQEAPKEEAEK